MNRSPNPHIIPQLIVNAAESAPGKIAVRCAGDELSYEQLVTRCARLATALLAHGIEPGQPVGVHMAKSLEAVVAIHGIQRAGAISVPIDPMAPPAAVLETSRALGLAGMVTDALRATRLGDWPGRPKLFGPADDGDDIISWVEIAEHDVAPLPNITGDDPAYMITTSGSTGAPKAIVHSHRSGLRYAQLAADCYGLKSEDRLVSVSPFHFDMSTFDLFAGPVARSTAILVPEPLLKFPADLCALVERERATVWYSVPTILIQMLYRGAMEQRDLSRLRWVLFGGEVFPAGTLAALMAQVPDARFSNVYGPAEVNQCTYHHLDAAPDPDSSISIGKPWEDTEVRVVDDDGCIVKGHGSGELHVRTATMMAGYWNRPDLTEAAVSRETSASGLSERWYRTGDIVERDPEDLLHFLGRADRQVKVRGNRIELESVEAAVSDAPGVLTCAVVVVGEHDATMLVAVVEADDEIDTRAIIASVSAVLPPYSVPDKVIVIDALPHTTSGKIDPMAASMEANLQLCGVKP